jgi:hypothetical protein
VLVRGERDMTMSDGRWVASGYRLRWR